MRPNRLPLPFIHSLTHFLIFVCLTQKTWIEDTIINYSEYKFKKKYFDKSKKYLACKNNCAIINVIINYEILKSLMQYSP